MGLLADILIIVAALASLILVLRWRRSKRLERLLTLLVAIIGLAVPSLDLIFREDIQEAINDRVDPLEAKVAERADSTDRLFEARLDSTNLRLACRMDSLETLIKSMAGQKEPDSSLRAHAREQAECLDGIVETALDKGIVAIGLGKYDKALILLDLALTAAGDNLKHRSDVFFYIGLIRFDQREFTFALDCYDSCVTYRPQGYETWYNRGWVLDELKRYEEAIASYDSALRYSSVGRVRLRTRQIVRTTRGPDLVSCPSERYIITDRDESVPDLRLFNLLRR